MARAGGEKDRKDLSYEITVPLEWSALEAPQGIGSQGGARRIFTKQAGGFSCTFQSVYMCTCMCSVDVVKFHGNSNAAILLAHSYQVMMF